MIRPRMREFMPAPGGAFWSSPRARMVAARKAVPRNSVKKAVQESIQASRWLVTKLAMMPVVPVAMLVLRYSRMDW